MTPEEAVADFLAANKEIERRQELGSRAVRARAMSGKPNIGYGDLIAREQRLRDARDENASRLALVEKYIKDREIGDRLRRSMAVQDAPHTPAMSQEELAADHAYWKDYRQRKAAQGEAPRSGAFDILRHTFNNDEDAKNIAKGLALTAGLAGGFAAPAMVPAAPALTGAAINALTGVLPNLAFDAPEGIAQDAIAGGVLGKLAGAGHPGLGAAASLLSYVPTHIGEAEAMPFHSWLKRLSSRSMNPEAHPLYVNPTLDELGDLRRSARVYGARENLTPTIRMMKDRKSPTDVFAWDGTDTLHQEVADHLKRPRDDFTGSKVLHGEDAAAEVEFLRSLKADDVPGMAGGGLVTKGLRAMFPNLAEPAYVVKPKGGNWLTGSVEGALSGLKAKPTKGRMIIPEGVEVPRDVWNPVTAEDGASISSYLKIGPKNETETLPYAGYHLNDWITGPLTKYVKTRMASPEDEVRALAEQGVLHVNQDDLQHSIRTPSGVVHQRSVAGFPEPFSKLQEGLPTAGVDWETVSDSFVTSVPAERYSSAITVGGNNPGTTYLRDNPWLANIPPETPVYDLAHHSTGAPQLAPSLGFDHLIDELSNALNPNSGLPRHLQLTPEAVKNMSMEKAVRRVHDINEWRAAQKVEANRQLAEQASVVREYAENNPKGLRWVELKATPGREVSDDELRAAMQERDMLPDEIESALADPKQRSEIAKMFNDEEGLAAQLKYEGDTMGHCVGGYCDDVLSGRSRIFSLRDAKGEPHVTVEVGKQNIEPEDAFYRNLPANIQDQLRMIVESRIDPPLKRIGAAKILSHDDHDRWSAEMRKLLRETYPDEKFEQTPSIVQIKGKANRKPNDEYLPFVQDFVRNSPLGAQWSDVGDLQNTGLTSIGGRHFTEQELRKAYDASGFSIPFDGLGMDYMDMVARGNLGRDKADDLFLKALGFASGGPVRVLPKPTDPPLTTGIRGHSPEDVVKQFLSEMI